MTLLSICIATRNRERYAVSCVRSILKNKSRDFEVILQDNSDVKTLHEVLADVLDDPRFFYNYTPPPFSSIKNFNRALELSRGKYVTLIGDDDFINSELFEISSIIDRHGIECVVGSLSVGYRWPDTGMVSTFFTDTVGGELTINGYTGCIKRGGGLKEVERLLSSGAYQYLRFHLPKFYHGIVKKELFEKIRSKTGTYIGGLSPDIYTAVSLALHATTVLYVDYPLTIPGVCAESSSVNEGSHKKTGGSFSAVPLLRDVQNYVRSPNVPDVYCLETVWADSCLAALNDLGRHDLLRYFNSYALAGAISIEHPELAGKAMQYLEDRGRSGLTRLGRARVAIHMLRARFFFLLPRVKRRLMILFRITSMTRVRGVNDVEQAATHLDEYLVAHRECCERLKNEFAKFSATPARSANNRL